MKTFPGTSKTYRQIIVSTIKNRWKGQHKIMGLKATLRTQAFNINDGKTHITSRRRKSAAINTADQLGLSNVSYPVHWLFFSYWSKNAPGAMTLYRGYFDKDHPERNPNRLNYNLKDFKCVVAHEFGHMLGVDDLYNKRYSIQSKYTSIMGKQEFSHTESLSVTSPIPGKIFKTEFVYGKDKYSKILFYFQHAIADSHMGLNILG